MSSFIGDMLSISIKGDIYLLESRIKFVLSIYSTTIRLCHIVRRTHYPYETRSHQMSNIDIFIHISID